MRLIDQSVELQMPTPEDLKECYSGYNPATEEFVCGPMPEDIFRNYSRWLLKSIEKAGRTCYRSEEKITDESCFKFIDMIVKNGHYSVLEHANLTVKFITCRSVTHELVRHRLCAFSQESTRYVNYNNDEHINYIRPIWLPEWILGEYRYESDLHELKQKGIPGWEAVNFIRSLIQNEEQYKILINSNRWSAQYAREILANALSTTIICTTNVREWRHIISLRTSIAAHPMIRNLMLQLYKLLREDKYLFKLFEDIRPPSNGLSSEERKLYLGTD